VNQFLTITEAATYEYVSQWGSSGIGDGEFGAPEFIAIDSSGNVYVSETSNDRVSKYTSDGTLLGWWGKDDLGGTGWHDPGSGRTANNPGYEDGALSSPKGIAIDSLGNVYVADDQNHRVCKFTSNGTFLGWWGQGWKDGVGTVYGWFDPGTGFEPRSGGANQGGFGSVHGIAIDDSDIVYVLGTQHVHKAQADGTFLGWWGKDNLGGTGWHDPGTASSPTYGLGDGEFKGAIGIAVDSSGYVYVTDEDAQQQRVQKFTNAGTFLGWWGHDTTGYTGWHDPGSGREGTMGEGDGQFYYPYGIAVDSDGLIYVINSWRPRFQVFTSTGDFLGWWGKDNDSPNWTGWHLPGTGLTGSAGALDGQFSSPFGVVVDSAGNIYVTDGGNSRIQKFLKIE
jgi:streptogramin lyase